MKTAHAGKQAKSPGRVRRWAGSYGLYMLWAVFGMVGLTCFMINPGGQAEPIQERAIVQAVPEKAGDTDFVEISKAIPGITIDLPYARSGNIAGRPLYSSNTSYIRKATAAKLAIAQKLAQAKGYSIKIWDAYRPHEVQKALWQARPDPNGLVDPAQGYSVHTRGAAVDVTLVDAYGRELAMPSTYDDFSALADRDFTDVEPMRATNAGILADIMREAGFDGIFSEWWHFNDDQYLSYPPVVKLELPPEGDNAADKAVSSGQGEPGNGSNQAGTGENAQSTDEKPVSIWEWIMNLIGAVIDWFKSFLGLTEPAGAKALPDRPTTIKISAVGDCTLGGGPGFDQRLWLQDGDYGYFFAGVSSFLKDDDLTIANLENTFTNADVPADKSHQAHPFHLNGRPDYARILTEGSIEAVNLANNHTYDYLQAGLDETRLSLDQAGVLHYGYDEQAIIECKGRKIALLGYNCQGPLEEGVDPQVLRSALISDLAAVRSQADLVIVSFHWGIEGSQLPTDEQYTLGRLAIDSGADLVLGHGPHVIQAVEKYKERFIVYSLGNFSFGANDNPPDRASFIYTQQFVCCGNQVSALEPVLVPCAISSSPEVNDYRPIAVYGREAELIEARLAW